MVELHKYISTPFLSQVSQSLFNASWYWWISLCYLRCVENHL